MMSAQNQIFTIGYEGRDIHQFVDLLTRNKVEVLYDVRYRPTSRKPGFAKTGLAQACESAGIDYRHDRELGTPPELMKRVKESGGYSEAINEEYREVLKTKTDALRHLGVVSARSTTCLLCYEADPSDCHRTVVAERIAIDLGQSVVHL